MNSEIPTLKDLQEIIFWQQLNIQLMELKSNGKPITDLHHEYLQTYCFENKLFSEITGAPLITDIPLILNTDLSNITCITLNLNSWSNCLQELFPGMYILDIEQALADTFDALQQYKDQYPETRQETEDHGDDDEELYQFINEYMAIREKQKRNIADLSQKLHELKANAITHIKERMDLEPFKKKDKDGLSLNFEGYDGRGDLDRIYIEMFCKEAQAIVRNIRNPINELDIYSYVQSKQDRLEIKLSIKTFFDHEMSLLQKETALFDTFLGNVNSRICEEDPHGIQFCESSSLSFLNYPFPLL